MPRKFSYSRDGLVVPTSKAVSDCRNACVEYGLTSVANTPVGYVFGYLIRCLEDKDYELSELRKEIEALKTPAVEEELVNVTEEFNPDGTPKKAYKNMTASERAAYRRSKGE
jgi:hypothetical protein